MAKTINDEFMQQVATEQAWKDLSETFSWTETLLEKYSENVDWKLISTNGNIHWTISMLKKFSRKLDWSEISRNIDKEWFTEAHLEELKDKWDWSILTYFYQLSEKLVDKYIDYIDWESFIGEKFNSGGLPRDDNFDAIAFYEKYKEHIPMSTFHESELWKKIVEQLRRKLMKEIMS